MNTGMVSMMRQLWMITLLLPIAVASATSGGLLSIYSGGYDLQAADSLYVRTTIRGQVAITKTTQVFRSMYQKKATVIFGCALHSAAVDDEMSSTNILVVR
jgi:hypothetical protein